MNPISFGSTYVVKNASSKNFIDFQTFAKEEQRLHDGAWFSEINYADSDDKLCSLKGVLVAPDERDSVIETYCAEQGILFEKYKTKDLLKPETIVKRIAPAKEGFQMVEVDVEKLEDLLVKHQTNYYVYRDFYNKQFKSDVEKLLRKDDNIPAATLRITTNSGNIEGNSESIEIDKDTIFICFMKSFCDNDEFMYFAMKELGMKKIPVYVYEKNLVLCQKLGLI